MSRSCKIEDVFRDTSIDLYEAEEMALPFWIYFVSGNSGAPKDQLMVKLFEKCEQEKGKWEFQSFFITLLEVSDVGCGAKGSTHCEAL